MKKYLILLITLFFVFNTPPVLAAQKTGGQDCTPVVDTCVPTSDWSCQRNPNPATNPPYYCQKISVDSTFGKIIAPSPIAGLVGKGGAGGLSEFLSNLIALFYAIAIVVLIFMFIWGAFDWLTSEGDKEKVQSAQKKIINAIIGIILFAVAFAVIQVLGVFTGFKFFVGQQP